MNLNIKAYKTIALPVVIYGCETWSLTLKEECRLRVFENRNLRRKFGFRRDLNEEWRRLHNEDLNSLYRSPNLARVFKSRRLRWPGHVARIEGVRSAFKMLTGKPTLKRTLEILRRRWEDNVGIGLEEIGINTRNWALSDFHKS